MEALKKIAQAYQRVMKDSFPSVYIEATQEAALIVMDAYLVPDNQTEDFSRFVLDQLPQRLEKEGVPFLPITPYSVSATQKYFPAIWQKGRSASRCAVKVKTGLAKKTSRPEQYARPQPVK